MLYKYINLDSNVCFEDIEMEIETNLKELRVLNDRLQDLNKDLGYHIMLKEFFKAVERLQLETFFKYMGPHKAQKILCNKLIVKLEKLVILLSTVTPLMEITVDIFLHQE